MPCNHAPLVFVCFRLERFRIERLRPVQRVLQIFRLVQQVGIGSIFRQHQFLIRIVLLQAFHPRFDILQFLFIPAEIAVHSLYIGVQVDRMLHVSVAVYRNSVTVGIFCLCKVMQRLSQFLGIFVRMIDFVMQPPDIDRRVVEALADQFAELASGIFGLLSGNTVHERNLRPDDQP